MLRTIAAFDRIGEENAFAVLARATQARRGGPRHHQSRHRPAGFPHPRPHRRGRGEGAARRPSRLHPRKRHPAAARGGGRRSPQAVRRRRIARRGHDHAGRQADHVHVDPDVRRTGRRHSLSRSRISDLPLDDRVHRRAADPGAGARGERLRLLGGGNPGADYAADAAADPQFARQPDRRRDAQKRGRQAGRRPRPVSRCRRDVRRDLRPHGL